MDTSSTLPPPPPSVFPSADVAALEELEAILFKDLRAKEIELFKTEQRYHNDSIIAPAEPAIGNLISGFEI